MDRTKDIDGDSGSTLYICRVYGYAGARRLRVCGGGLGGGDPTWKRAAEFATNFDCNRTRGGRGIRRRIGLFDLADPNLAVCFQFSRTAF